MAKLKKLNNDEMNESRKRFIKLVEYSFVNKEDDLLLDEDDDETQNQTQEPQQFEQPNEIQNPDDGQLKGNDEQLPNQDNQQMDVQQMDAQQGNQNIEPIPDVNNTPNEPGEVEIDVTDLTKKQSEIETAVSSMSNQTNKLMDTVSALADKVQSIIQNTDIEMAKIKDEIVKRNPTPVEVLQKRITVSDPFSQTPKDYWDKKEKEGHYKLSDDNDELELRGSDINGSASEIYKSFGVDDDDWNQSLSSIFRI